MLARPAPPVFAVPGIRLAAMHDRVPATSRRRVNLLADPVRFIQIVMIKPDSREAAPSHFLVPNGQRKKKPIDSQFSQQREQTDVWRTGTKLRQPFLLKQARGVGRIGPSVEG